MRVARSLFDYGPWPGGGWTYTTDSETRKVLESLEVSGWAERYGGDRFRLAANARSFFEEERARFEEERARRAEAKAFHEKREQDNLEALRAVLGKFNEAGSDERRMELLELCRNGGASDWVDVLETIERRGGNE